MICRVCHGSGNVGPYKFMWACPACASTGVSIQYGPAKIVCPTFNKVPKRKKSKKENK